MQTFEGYLGEHKLVALTVSVTAKVRYMTVYNARKGIPITPEHANLIRQAVFMMSGVPFTDSFVLTQPEPIEELPTLPINRIPKRNLF